MFCLSLFVGVLICGVSVCMLVNVCVCWRGGGVACTHHMAQFFLGVGRGEFVVFHCWFCPFTKACTSHPGLGDILPLQPFSSIHAHPCSISCHSGSCMLTLGSDLCHITQVVVTGSSLNHISIFMQLWLVTSPMACECWG